MPVGAYQLLPDRLPQRGDFVVVHLPPLAAAAAAERGYLLAGRPALKRIAGVTDDRICRIGNVVSINGRLAAVALARDRTGRRLPRWFGCRRLSADEIFALGTAAGSFDGRYFGIMARSSVVGVARPLWIIRN